MKRHTRFNVLTSEHIGLSPHALTIPEQCKVYESGNILLFRFVRFLKDKSSAALCPLVPETAVGQGSVVGGISIESAVHKSALWSHGLN
jgi:hypothetical protein